MAKGFGTNKDTKKMIRAAQDQGWVVDMTKGNHIRFRAPNGEVVISGLTPCNSGVLQTRKRLIKAGLTTV